MVLGLLPSLLQPPPQSDFAGETAPGRQRVRRRHPAGIDGSSQRLALRPGSVRNGRGVRMAAASHDIDRSSSTTSPATSSYPVQVSATREVMVMKHRAVPVRRERLIRSVICDTR